MVISSNPEPNKLTFLSLMDNTLRTLDFESKKNQEKYLGLLGNKLDIPYDTLRNYSNPIKPITEYYRQFLKTGEEVWWLDQEEPKSTGLIIKIWNNLPVELRKQYMLKSMIIFPEIFSNRPDKFNRLSVWLVNKNSKRIKGLDIEEYLKDKFACVQS